MGGKEFLTVNFIVLGVKVVKWRGLWWLVDMFNVCVCVFLLLVVNPLENWTYILGIQCSIFHKGAT